MGHTGDDMVMSESPTLSDVTILNPDIRIISRQRHLYGRILHENRRMRLTVDVHNLALVVHQILDALHRGNHLPRGSEVVELTTGQW